MNEVVRASISFPPELLEEFDSLIKKMGYKKRSQAICDAMRNFIVEYYWKEVEGEVIGVISIVYEHERGLVAEKLLDVEHSFDDIIISTMHVHLDKENCLEVLIGKGPATRIRGLLNGLISLKGVKHVKLSMTSLVK